jgi:hypothetical protein
MSCNEEIIWNCELLLRLAVEVVFAIGTEILAKNSLALQRRALFYTKAK